VSTLIALALHLAFWTTLVFAIVERTPGRRSLSTWTPAQLPQLPAPGRVGIGEVIATAVFTVIFGGLLVWQQISSVLTDESGAPIPLLEPRLWNFWLPYFLVLLVLEVVFQVVVWRTGRWTYPLAAINVVSSLLFAIPALWLLLTAQLFNAEFFAELGATRLVEVGSATVTITAVVVVLIPLWDVVAGFPKARRGRRAGA